MKRVKSFIKRIGHAYLAAYNKTYAPLINAGVNPWL